jgi:predicted nuclease of restriction endonuclease-like (RecB) superfamily
MNQITFYTDLFQNIKQRIRQAQTRAILAVNSELIRLYWDIGRMLDQRQQMEGWGTGFIPKLAMDLRNELPEVKGFSKRNIGYMLQFAREYGDPASPNPIAVIAQDDYARRVEADVQPLLQQRVAKIPWGHNLLLMERVKDRSTRLWYIQQTIAQGWSRNTLASMISSRLHERQGQSTTNFPSQLPSPQSDLAQQTLKDPYIFDFLTLEEPFHERELETGLIRHLENFLLELGQGFAFVGRQYLVSVGDDDFYIDLLFYHLRLRCFVVIDLKRGKFKPEYAGKINFYCNIVDDYLRHSGDQATIGLILCQEKNTVVAEYALRGMNKPIGVSEYELTRALPNELKSSLPTIEELEAELSGMGGDTGED